MPSSHSDKNVTTSQSSSVVPNSRDQTNDHDLMVDDNDEEYEIEYEYEDDDEDEESAKRL